ncbi:MAG TPA: glycosyltransferase family 2 protein [Vicinamibacterales bacterium]
MPLTYAIVTAARNEAAIIEQALRSVTAQTIAPLRWVILDDGSTDETAAIVERYAARHPWIELVRQAPREGRSFAGKAAAVNAGFERLRPLAPDVVVNLDADVSFPSDYMERLLARFEADPRLGVAGTYFTEPDGYDSARDSFEGAEYVAGPCQLFRRTCFEEIGGYVAHRAGGVDWIAVMTARMRGWQVRAFDDARFHHHRKMGTAERGQVAALFSYGQKDYYLGGSPIWQVFRVAYRAFKPPFLVGGLALGAGYVWAAVRRVPRPVSKELMRFHRADQMRKLRRTFHALLRRGRLRPELPASTGVASS